MLEAYSTNISVSENAAIPFNSVSVLKGCTVTHPSPDTIDLNKCGVYMVSVDASASSAVTIQLYKDGVAQLQAQSTGESVSFVTLIQVPHDNSCCPCASPTTVQIINTVGTGAYTNANVVVTKLV